MNPEQIASQLRQQNKIGLRIISVEAWGRPLLRPDDTSLELIDASARGDLLVLTLSPNTSADKRVGAMELAIEKAAPPTIGDDAISFPSAIYIRFDELALRLRGGKVSPALRGQEQSPFDPAAAPALVLRRDPFAG